MAACATKSTRQAKQIQEDLNTYAARGNPQQCAMLLSKARLALKSAQGHPKKTTVADDNNTWSKPAELIGSAKLAKAAGDYWQCSVKARKALKYIERGKNYLAWKHHLSS
jgi:hypothetical protein